MSCPGAELVYNPIVQGCDLNANSVCPGDDYRGHIERNLIFPELIVHSTCGYRHRNGAYDFYKQANDFMTLDLCGYKQSCSADGKLSIVQCPNGKLWNNDTDTCVPTNQMPICEPSSKWTKQSGVDLDECIGLVDGRCEIGFTELTRAQKYCEHSDECVGVKQMPCNQISVNMNCIGVFWRPFITIVKSVNTLNDVFIYQRDNLGEQHHESDDGQVKNKYQFNYAAGAQLYYAGCADDLYNNDGTCSMSFATVDEGLRHCDKYKSCRGVAKYSGLYIAVEHVSKEKRKLNLSTTKFETVD